MSAGNPHFNILKGGNKKKKKKRKCVTYLRAGVTRHTTTLRLTLVHILYYYFHILHASYLQKNIIVFEWRNKIKWYYNSLQTFTRHLPAYVVLRFNLRGIKTERYDFGKNDILCSYIKTIQYFCTEKINCFLYNLHIPYKSHIL